MLAAQLVVVTHPECLWAAPDWVVDWHWSRPIWRELNERIAGGVVLQSPGASCAAASAANLLAAHGIVRTEPELAALFGPTAFGTAPSRMVRGLATFGLAFRKVERSSRDISAMPLPALLLLPPRGASAGHVVVLESAEDERVHLVDPLSGRTSLSLTQLVARWDGRAIECVTSGSP